MRYRYSIVPLSSLVSLFTTHTFFYESSAKRDPFWPFAHGWKGREEMSPRWNDAPGDALRAVRLRVIKEEEEEDTKTSSALPKREEIIERFGLFGTPRRSNDSDDDDEEEENKKCEMEFTTGTCSNGKTCNRCDRWQRFVDGIGGRAASLTTKKYYEVFTSDLVRGVVRHVKERWEEESTKEKVVLLELGARDGTFARAFVREWAGGRLEYFACDTVPMHESVTKRDAIEAIRDIGKTFENTKTLCIALVSWMPFQIDWTQEIRKHSAFDEYILIGEGEGGMCGSEQTFGRRADDDDDDDDDNMPPLYEREGFIMHELKEIRNLGKSDTTYERGTHSKTISFRRRLRKRKRS